MRNVWIGVAFFIGIVVATNAQQVERDPRETYQQWHAARVQWRDYQYTDVRIVQTNGACIYLVSGSNVDNVEVIPRHWLPKGC